MKKLLLFNIFLFASCAANAAANYSIGDAVLDKQANTVTSCLNSQGFYFEIGQPAKIIPYTIKGFAHDMPLVKAIKNSLYPGWHAVYGQGVDQSQKITWIAKESWTTWLQKIAFNKNLAMIVDWKNRTLYINQL